MPEDTAPENHVQFPSLFDIGDPVYVSLQGLQIAGHVRAVTFTTGKVRYAVSCSISGPDGKDPTTLHNLDSVLLISRKGEKVKFDIDNYS